MKTLITWIKSLFQPELTPAQRREQHCAHGQHRYNRTAAVWWIAEPQTDSEASLTYSGTHCKDCGHWDCE